MGRDYLILVYGIYRDKITYGIKNREKEKLIRDSAYGVNSREGIKGREGIRRTHS